MKHILVPTDFSEAAQNAIDVAIEIHKIVPSKITLLHSFEVFDDFYVDYMGLNREFNVSIIQDIQERLNQLKSELMNKHQIEMQAEVINMPLQNAVSLMAEEHQVDMVVMGTQGASGLEEKLWGSRTASVIGKSPVPVLAIPKGYKWKKPEKVLLSTNQFEKDSHLLNYLFEWADLFMAEVHVAVFSDKDKESAAAFLKQAEELEEYAVYLRKTFQENSLTATQLAGEDFETSMNAFIEENEMDVLIMITYQHGFLKRLFNPSLTKKMSFHIGIPLLALPANYKK